MEFSYIKSGTACKQEISFGGEDERKPLELECPLQECFPSGFPKEQASPSLLKLKGKWRPHPNPMRQTSKTHPILFVLFPCYYNDFALGESQLPGLAPFAVRQSLDSL